MKIITTDEKRLLSDIIVSIQAVKVHLKKTYLSLKKLPLQTEAAYSAYKKWCHTIQMTNDRPVYIVIDKW